MKFWIGPRDEDDVICKLSHVFGPVVICYWYAQCEVCNHVLHWNHEKHMIEQLLFSGCFLCHDRSGTEILNCLKSILELGGPLAVKAYVEGNK